MSASTDACLLFWASAAHSNAHFMTVRHSIRDNCVSVCSVNVLVKLTDAMNGKSMSISGKVVIPAAFYPLPPFFTSLFKRFSPFVASPFLSCAWFRCLWSLEMTVNKVLRMCLLRVTVCLIQIELVKVHICQRAFQIDQWLVRRARFTAFCKQRSQHKLEAKCSSMRRTTLRPHH